MSERDAIIERLARNPRLLHATLFPHRHGDETPQFHLEMIDDWWSDFPYVGEEAFRGGAKSTVFSCGSVSSANIDGSANDFRVEPSPRSCAT